MTRLEEYQHKRDRLLAYMESHHLDALILTRRCNFAWLTGGGLNHVSTGTDTGAAALLVTARGTRCITNTIEAPRIAHEELAELGIAVDAYEWHDPSDAARIWAAAVGQGRVGGDERVPGLGMEITPLGSDFDALRWSLLPAEIARYRALGRDVAACLESACRTARAGMTELELAGVIAAGLLARGIRAPVILVAADERIAQFRHPLPTARPFMRYGMAVCGGERGGLVVSVTRLFSFGAIDPELQRRHRAVCQVDAELIHATRPGSTLGAVFAVAQKAYADAGFPDEWRHHHQGGSTGYLPREVKATPGNPTEILAHQAFAWNPTIAGTKSEDTILVTPEGYEILSATGDWPMLTCTTAGGTIERPDILTL